MLNAILAKADFPVHFRTLFLAALLLAPLGFTASEAEAQTSRVFTVRDLPVDQRAATEVAAKDAAIAAGRQRALTMLLQRLTLPEDWGRLPTVPAAETEGFIRNISFSDERIGGGRYLANVTYRFRPSAVRPLLTGAGIPYSETASRPMVVLPILESPSGTKLWDEGNMWFDAWRTVEPMDGLAPLIVPLGDLSDVSAIGLQQALAGEPVSIGRIAGKYRAGGALTVVARPAPIPGAGVGLTLTVTGYGRGWESTSFAESVAPAAGETPEDLYARSAQLIAVSIERYWKQANLISAAQGEQRIAVTVPLSDLRAWLSVQEKLSKLVIVRRTEIKELTITAAELEISYTGDLVQLRRGLSQQNLGLAQRPEDGRWLLEAAR